MTRFIFIIGVHPRETVIDRGPFYCPHCGQSRHYTQKEVRPYLSLYFIPLFPVGSAQTLYQCDTCRMSFDVDVLQHPQPEKPKRQTVSDLINATKDRLLTGEPVDYVIRDLTAAGVDRELALNMIAPYLGPESRVCPSCGLTYASHVSTCMECGKALT
jgi:predicted RNA-binding Zn-ribbon protein involved in translation (DUF1610 family)